MEIDRIAHEESRSRSEFIREAARSYIQRKRRWSDIFSMGRRIAEQKGLSEADVFQEIAAHRNSKATH